MVLHDAVTIRTTPERIFEFFREMERNYPAWHPEHVRFRWVAGRGLREGVVFSFEEHIAGKLLRKRVRFTRVEPGRHLEFAPTNPVFRLFLPRLLFHVEPEGDGCRLTAEIHVRMGPLAAWLHRRELAAVRRHMREEGENMKRLLEAAPAVLSS